MRVRIVQKPDIPSVDGVRLTTFESGHLYDVNSALGLYMIANGWAYAVMSDDPAELIPLSDFNASEETPPNLRREFFPPYYDGPSALAFDRRRRTRAKH